MDSDEVFPHSDDQQCFRLSGKKGLEIGNLFVVFRLGLVWINDSTKASLLL
jgi:hypothetical protein